MNIAESEGFCTLFESLQAAAGTLNKEKDFFGL